MNPELSPGMLRAIHQSIGRLERKLAGKGFAKDPLFDPRYSLFASVAGSAQKRHGQIIEAAVVDLLRQTSHYQVFREDQFWVLQATDNLISSMPEDACRLAALPYAKGEKGRDRWVQVDLFAYDLAARAIKACEIKRGNSLHDAGKQRSMKRDLLCVQVLLRSFAEQRGLAVASAESRVLFYYGMRSVPAPWSLVRGPELDEYFSAPVTAYVEAATGKFRELLFQFLGLPPDPPQPRQPDLLE